MSQDEELRKLLQNMVLIIGMQVTTAYEMKNGIWEGLSIENTKTISTYERLFKTREATLIREARIDELEDLQIKGKGNKFTPFEYHYYINNRITELTNQQKGEQ